MNTKLFEVRATATNIPIIATKLEPSNEQEQWLLGHCGYGQHGAEQSQYIMVARLEAPSTATTTEYEEKSHEMQIAHRYLNASFDELESGAVIDINYIEGRVPEPVKSDRFYRR
jgi:hypothetical protein